MKTIFAALSVLALACSPSTSAPVASASGSTAAAPPPATGAAPAAGRLDATFTGECMPQGSRGGCYSLTLRGDGTFTEVLLDASQSGTYEIKGNTLVLTYPKGAREPQTLTTSDGWKTLSNGYKKTATP